MQIVFIDGLGGGLMAQVLSQLPDNLKKNNEIIALGTNALAGAAMVKSGAKNAASGEAAICYSVKTADLIVAPMGVIIPHAMYGEVTPKIAKKVAGAASRKILIPVANTNITIAGLKTKTMNMLIKDTIQEIISFVSAKGDVT